MIGPRGINLKEYKKAYRAGKTCGHDLMSLLRWEHSLENRDIDKYLKTHYDIPSKGVEGFVSKLITDGYSKGIWVCFKASDVRRYGPYTSLFFKIGEFVIIADDADGGYLLAYKPGAKV